MTKEEIINRFLKDEKILWQGKPFKVPTFNKSDIFMIPFTIIFGGSFILYSIISALVMFAGKDIMFALIGITFLLIGIYLLFLRFWYRKKRIKRQLYFVTNKRVFSFDTLRDEVIFDIPLYETQFYMLDKTLILGDTNVLGDFIYNLGLDIFFRKISNETPSFKYINDIDKVAEIINSNIKTAKETEDDTIFI